MAVMREPCYSNAVKQQAFLPDAGVERTCCNVVSETRGLECCICKYVMDGPMLMSCCGEHLCRPCVDKIHHSKLPGVRCCPFCQQDFTSLLNRGKEREVLQLEVECPNVARGCSWRGMLKTAKQHISPQGAAMENGCPFQMVKCRIPECLTNLLRRNLLKHENELCEFRRYTCKYCLDVTDTYHKVLTEHFPVCPDCTVPCPNQCEAAYMFRSAIGEHLSTSCPLQEVVCEYASAGCNVKVLRKDVASHCETASQYHNKLLLDQNAALKMELDEHRQQLLRVVQQQTEQGSRFEALLSQQDSKHQQQLSLLEDRLTDTTDCDESLKESASGGVQFAEQKLVNLENSFVVESSDVRSELSAITAEVFLLKDSHEEISKFVTEVASKSTVMDQTSRDVQQLCGSLEAFKSNHRVLVESVVVQQIGPTLIEVEELREKIAGSATLVTSMQENLDYLENCMTPQPPFSFTVSRFSERKVSKEPFVSAAFYTHRRGYKMCVRVDPHGMGHQVAVHCCIMKGEHDGSLGWPFRGSVHLRIQNQLGDHTHYLIVITYDDTTANNKCSQVSTGDKNYLHGFNQFISHQKLEQVNDCQYLKGDAVDFEVVKVDVEEAAVES